MTTKIEDKEYIRGDLVSELRYGDSLSARVDASDLIESVAIKCASLDGMIYEELAVSGDNSANRKHYRREAVRMIAALTASRAQCVTDELNPDALKALKEGQRQLDMDGVEVGVSRQALDELIAALEATQLSARPMVKALEWSGEGVETCYAATQFGEYSIDYYTEIDGQGWELAFADTEVIGHYPSEAEAKDAAQVHWENHIRSALEGEGQ